MNVEFQNVRRTLQEFYPDPPLRHQVHYAFAHRFLPEYVQQNPYAFFSYLYRQKIEPTRFIHSRWSSIFEQRAGLSPVLGDVVVKGRVVRCVTDLSMSLHEVSEKPAALVQMPKPEEPVEAFFVAAVLLAPLAQPESWAPDVQARVFTLEAEISGPPDEGVFCEWTKEGGHRNFGLGVRVDPDAFLGAIAKVL